MNIPLITLDFYPVSPLCVTSRDGFESCLYIWNDYLLFRRSFRYHGHSCALGLHIFEEFLSNGLDSFQIILSVILVSFGVYPEIVRNKSSDNPVFDEPYPVIFMIILLPECRFAFVLLGDVTLEVVIQCARQYFMFLELISCCFP